MQIVSSSLSVTDTQRSVQFGTYNPPKIGRLLQRERFQNDSVWQICRFLCAGVAMVTLISECGWTPSGVCVQV
jgi:hypothetical protein